jgi:quercetin dioxygenase-like cupin family protein
MLAPNQTLDMTSIGMIFHIVKTAQETNGQSLEMEWEVLPKCDGTPVHIHPFADETYQVLEGSLEVQMNGEWKILTQGETMTVPKGASHTFRNLSNNVARVFNTHAPAMKFDSYFEELSNIVNKLSGGKKDKQKMNLNAIMYMCMLMKKYPAEMVSVNPPPFVVSLMNVIGKLSGRTV